MGFMTGKFGYLSGIGQEFPWEQVGWGATKKRTCDTYTKKVSSEWNANPCEQEDADGESNKKLWNFPKHVRKSVQVLACANINPTLNGLIVVSDEYNNNQFSPCCVWQKHLRITCKICVQNHAFVENLFWNPQKQLLPYIRFMCGGIFDFHYHWNKRKERRFARLGGGGGGFTVDSDWSTGSTRNHRPQHLPSQRLLFTQTEGTRVGHLNEPVKIATLWSGKLDNRDNFTKLEEKNLKMCVSKMDVAVISGFPDDVKMLVCAFWNWTSL